MFGSTNIEPSDYKHLVGFFDELIAKQIGVDPVVCAYVRCNREPFEIDRMVIGDKFTFPDDPESESVSMEVEIEQGLPDVFVNGQKVSVANNHNIFCKTRLATAIQGTLRVSSKNVLEGQTLYTD